MASKDQIDELLAAMNESPATEAVKPKVFFNYIDDLKKKWRSDFKPKSGPALRNAEEQAPPAEFDDVSICAQGPCKYLFWAKLPIPITVDDPNAPGGRRYMTATVRRCLAGIIELPSDELTPAGMLKKSSDGAPIATDCSHWTPLTDDELEDRTTRIAMAKARGKAANENLSGKSEEIIEPLEPVDPEQDSEDLAAAIALRDAPDDIQESPEAPTNEET